MIIDNKFLNGVGIDPTLAPDLKFSVLDTTTHSTVATHNVTPHARSTGTIKTVLGMHQLMAKSLSLLFFRKSSV